MRVLFALQSRGHSSPKEAKKLRDRREKKDAETREDIKLFTLIYDVYIVIILIPAIRLDSRCCLPIFFPAGISLGIFS